jgi:hypothetical protein
VHHYRWVKCQLFFEKISVDETFEALVAEILVQFIRKHDPKGEHVWIAERDGERIGSVMIVDAGDQVAQLRLLLVGQRQGAKVSATDLSKSASPLQGATATVK